MRTRALYIPMSRKFEKRALAEERSYPEVFYIIKSSALRCLGGKKGYKLGCTDFFRNDENT